MKERMLMSVAGVLLLACVHDLSAQGTATAPPPSTRPQTGTVVRAPERAVRRDIPMTNMIRRAFAAGTRDSTGRPGRNYWQLWTDYRISARLDPSTSRLSGRETVVIKNNSPDTLRQIGLRLDMN